MSKIRIQFYSDDFKTENWGRELEKLGCEVVKNPSKKSRYFHNIFYHSRTLLKQFFQKKKVHVFVFRYLNDSIYLRVSLEYLIRDMVTVMACKVLGIKILWFLHNIDRETKVRHPFISRLRRALVSYASDRVLVTDPLLIEFAINYGIDEKKLDWICFGVPDKAIPDEQNLSLRSNIENFKQSFYQKGFKDVVVGLCVSEPAKKKVHYLYADSIVGPRNEPENTCVVLVMIGNYPEGDKYQDAKKRVKKSPYILYIEESFSVNELYIADYIDFFYRSLSDQSIAYTLYVASDLNKPIITHNIGAMPLIVERENIGFVIRNSAHELSEIIISLAAWSSEGSKNFLKERTWKIAAERMLENIKKTGVQP
ncbi:hypothetical protein BH23BAC3_BH23BAC3_33700 [soil metagenome]